MDLVNCSCLPVPLLLLFAAGRVEATEPHPGQAWEVTPGSCCMRRVLLPQNGDRRAVASNWMLPL